MRTVRISEGENEILNSIISKTYYFFAGQFLEAGRKTFYPLRKVIPFWKVEKLYIVFSRKCELNCHFTGKDRGDVNLQPSPEFTGLINSFGQG